MNEHTHPTTSHTHNHAYVDDGQMQVVPAGLGGRWLALSGAESRLRIGVLGKSKRDAEQRLAGRLAYWDAASKADRVEP